MGWRGRRRRRDRAQKNQVDRLYNTTTPYCVECGVLGEPRRTKSEAQHMEERHRAEKH